MNKRIVIVRTSGSIIDYQTYNCQEIGLAKELVKKEYDVSLVFAGKEEAYHRIESGKYTINIYYAKAIKLNQALTYFKGIHRLLDKLNPDIIQIHEFGMFMSWYVLRYARKKNIKTVLIQGSYKPTDKFLFKQLEILFNKTFGSYIIEHVNGIGSKTSMASGYLKEYVNCYPYSTNIGLDTSCFIAANNKVWRAELNIPDKKVLLYVGQMDKKRRNVDFLIRLLKLLSDEFVLLLAGTGPDTEELKAYSFKLGVNDRCSFLGLLAQEDLPSLYTCADIFLLASNYEIYGMVILEAMYFGLPVITTHTAGSEAIIDNNENGIIIPVLDENLWKNKILSLCMDGNLSDMQKKAKAKINNSLTWGKTSESFITLYNRI